MEFVKKNALGILICLVIAVPAWLLGQRFEVVGGPVFAILIGMVIALFWKDQKSAKSGITYTSKKVLQLAVVLLGFGMNLSSGRNMDTAPPGSPTRAATATTLSIGRITAPPARGS